MGSSQQIDGKGWEDVFQRLVRYRGMLAKHNYIPCIRTPKGFQRVKKGHLDFRVFRRGQVGFFDLKSFGKEFFDFNQIQPLQIAEACDCNDWLIPSGFVVLFRGSKSVRFYSGHYVSARGPGSRFRPEDGVVLGVLEDFTLEPAFIAGFGASPTDRSAPGTSAPSASRT